MAEKSIRQEKSLDITNWRTTDIYEKFNSGAANSHAEI